MKPIRLLPQTISSFRPLAITMLVTLGIAVATEPATFAQSSSRSQGSSARPSQGSSSRPSPGSSFRGRAAPKFNGSGSTHGGPPQGSGTKKAPAKKQAASPSRFPELGSGSSSTQFPTQTPSGSSTKSPSQGAGGSGSDQASGDGKTSYFQLVSEIQKNEAEINRLYTSSPIGFPHKLEGHMKNIEALKARNIELKSMLNDAIVREYQQDPEKNAGAGYLIFKQMLQKLEPKNPELHYDPQGALEIANILMDGGGLDKETPGSVPFKHVAWQAFRASYALHDFDNAELMLDKIAERGTKVRGKYIEKLAKTRDLWQRELKIRRLEANTNDLPRVEFETTEGNFVVELFENHAPQTVGNFVDLVEKNFYNDMPFFKVVPGKFVQTGCRNGDGSGDAGYSIPCECYREQVRHTFGGTLSMVNNGRDTGGSQFFISHKPEQELDGRYTAFGRVKKGMDVIYRLQTVDKTKLDARGVEPSRIVKATVVWKRNHKYEATRVRSNDGYTNQQVAEEGSDFLDELQKQANAKNGTPEPRATVSKPAGSAAKPDPSGVMDVSGAQFDQGFGQPAGSDSKPAGSAQPAASDTLDISGTQFGGSGTKPADSNAQPDTPGTLDFSGTQFDGGSGTKPAGSNAQPDAPGTLDFSGAQLDGSGTKPAGSDALPFPN